MSADLSRSSACSTPNSRPAKDGSDGYARQRAKALRIPSLVGYRAVRSFCCPRFKSAPASVAQDYKKWVRAEPFANACRRFHLRRRPESRDDLALYPNARPPAGFHAGKGTNFFYRDLPLSWYSEQFADATERQHCGDISPNYAAFEGLAERIFSVSPSALVFHLLRDPVDRAFSQWKMARHLGNIPRQISFIEAFRQNLSTCGVEAEYGVILDEYARLYPLANGLGVFWYDDIRTRPADLVREIVSGSHSDHAFTPGP